MQTQFKPGGASCLHFLLSRCPLKLFSPGPLCRHGMRDDCPVEQCHFQNAKPSLYSSALKGPATTTPTQVGLTATNDPLAQFREFGTHDKSPGETYRFQQATAASSYSTVNDSAPPLLSCTSGTGTTAGTGPVDPTDGRGLAQGRLDPSPTSLQ